MAIIFVRHGETDGNAGRLLQTSDTPLNARGLAQAAALGRRLERDGVARIVTSDLARAYMTAEKVRDATGAPLDIDPRLRERDFGDWRGRTHDEVPYFLDEGLEPPNGETWEVFHARVAAMWARLAELAREVEGNLVAVTHGLVCYSFALHHIAPPAGVEIRPGFGNTSVTITEPDPPWTVTTWNCTAHLDDTEFASRVTVAS